MKIATGDIYLAKNVFRIHSVDERGTAVPKKQLKRHQVRVFFSTMPPCLVGIEGRRGAHRWACCLPTQGHTVRPMAQQFTKPQVNDNKWERCA